MNSNNREEQRNLIERYAIYMAGEALGVKTPDTKLSDSERHTWENLLERDPGLVDEVTLLTNTYVTVYKQMNGTALGEFRLPGQARQPNARTLRYSGYASISAALVLLLIIIFHQLLLPDYYPSFRASFEKKLIVTRNESSTRLSLGKALFKDRKYDRAALVFSNELKKARIEGNSDLIGLCAFYMGRMYLNKSKKTRFGILPSFSKAELDSAAAAFTISSKYAGVNTPYRYDLEFYSGVTNALAYFGEKDSVRYWAARNAFEKISRDSTLWSENAAAILSALHN